MALLGLSVETEIEQSARHNSSEESILPADDEPDLYWFLANYDPAEVWQAVERARSEYVADCMSDRGFQGDDVVDRRRQENESGLALDAERPVSALLEQIEQGLVPLAQAGSAQLTPEETDAYMECYRESENEYPNPNDTLLRVLEQIEDDVLALVEADSNVLDATIERDRCLESTGYGRAAMTADQALFEDVQRIGNDYMSGVVRRQKALALLEALLPVEHSISRCVDAYNEIWLPVLESSWRAVIERNPQLVIDLKRLLDEELRPYLVYLDG